MIHQTKFHLPYIVIFCACGNFQIAPSENTPGTEQGADEQSTFTPFDMDQDISQPPAGWEEQSGDFSDISSIQLTQMINQRAEERGEEVAEYNYENGSGGGGTPTENPQDPACGTLPAEAHCHNRSDYSACSQGRLVVKIHLFIVKCGHTRTCESSPGGPTFQTDLCVCPLVAAFLINGVRQFVFENFCINLTFAEAGYLTIRDDDGRFANIDTLEEFADLLDLRPPNDVGIPIYFVRSLFRGTVAGASPYPTAAHYGVVIANVGQNRSTLAHELGHALGLFHTFGDTQYGIPQEPCTNGHCRCQGDLICDTPPDPQCGYNLNNNTGVCTANCSNGACHPDTTNRMSYYPPNCRNRFSNDQKAVMTCWAKEERCRFINCN